MSKISAEIFKTFPDTGECELDIDKAVSAWHPTWFLSQWHDKFTLVAVGDAKAVIPKKQAVELIVELDLTPTKSEIFRHGKTWRKNNEPG